MPGSLFRRTSRQNFFWFSESRKEADSCRIATGGPASVVIPAISSPIYPLGTDDFSDKSHIYRREKKFGCLELSDFPYARIIRGDGGCYINGALVGILGRCIADKDRWQIFKKNVARISYKAMQIISRIEEMAQDTNRGGLDFLKLNKIFIQTGDQNLVTLLAKEILVPLHSNLTLKYQKKLSELSSQEKGEHQSGRECHHRNQEECYQYLDHIKQAKKDDFATSYEESMVQEIVTQLSWGMSTSKERDYLLVDTLSEVQFTAKDESQNYVHSGFNSDPSIIYLFNSSGGAHFNLWYKKEDPICREIEYQQNLATDSALRSRSLTPPIPRTLPLLIPQKTRQDQYFFSYRSQNQCTVEFSTMSICNQNGKFNYKKWLTEEEYNQYDPKAYNAEEEQRKIIDMLKQAKDQTMQMFTSPLIDNNFFVAVMKVASKNNGIGNISQQKFKKDFTEAYREVSYRQTSYLDDSEFHQIAKYFSATFQKLSGDEYYLTGRPGRDGLLNRTPRRLFRVCTEENIDMFKNELGVGLGSHRLLGSRATLRSGR